jgi:hypothetical protein
MKRFLYFRAAKQKAMHTAVIIITAFAATSFMTAFSYLISESFRKLYKEPLLLQYLMSRWRLKLSPFAKMVAGWCIHYSIGLIFVAAYYLLWAYGMYEISWVSGLIFGCIIGTIGICSWEMMFTLSDHKPKIDFSGYYLQLFIAHLIFAVTTFLMYQFLLN